MDEYLDQFMEDHLNGGYGHVLDELAAQERVGVHDPVHVQEDDTSAALLSHLNPPRT